MGSRAKKPPKTVQTKIRKTVKAFYKDRNLKIDDPNFYSEGFEIYLDYNRCKVNLISADENRCKIDLVSVVDNSTDFKVIDYINFETGEKFIIPELTEEEKAERAKIYRNFFQGIFCHHAPPLLPVHAGTALFSQALRNVLATPGGSLILRPCHDALRVLEKTGRDCDGLPRLEEKQILSRPGFMKSIINIVFSRHEVKQLGFPVKRQAVCCRAVVHQLFYGLLPYGVSPAWCSFWGFCWTAASAFASTCPVSFAALSDSTTVRQSISSCKTLQIAVCYFSSKSY